MVHKEIFHTTVDTMISRDNSVLFQCCDLSEMYDFVKAVYHAGDCNDKMGQDLDLKRKEYNKLKRRRNELDRQKLDILNHLLLENGCYNDYANLKAANCNLGKLKKVLDNAVLTFQDFLQNNICTDMPTDVVSWLLNNCIENALEEIKLNKILQKQILILNKVFIIDKNTDNNQIDRFFYSCDNLKDVEYQYMIPVIVGTKTQYDKMKIKILKTYMQTQESMQHKENLNKNCRQRIFCQPVWLNKYTSIGHLRKVW